MASKPKNVIIVGGSLAGLMSGILLKRLGINVRIFERSPSSSLSHQGAGIVFGPEAQEFFSKHINGNRPLTVSSKLRQTLARDGKVKDKDVREQKMVSWDLLYFVLRASFDGLESGYCSLPVTENAQGKGEYKYGCTVTGLRAVDHGVEIDFDDREGTKKSETADLIIGADGPSSTIRKLLAPAVERRYVGYVAWRGTIPENEASELMKETFVEKFTFYHGPGIQILTYLIPGKDGTLEPGSRLINWVWYCNYPQNSPEYKDLMTDATGKQHHFTMPASALQAHIWTAQKHHATEVLPPAFSELVNATKEPFIQAITDVLPSQPSFMDGKVLLVGDAVAGFRPHTAASTSQAAFHALLLDQMLKGKLGREEMLVEMKEYAQRLSKAGRSMGERSQFESLR